MGSKLRFLQVKEKNIGFAAVDPVQQLLKDLRSQLIK